MMNGFRTFIESKIQEEVKDLIRKLPEKFQDLVKGYKFKFENGCTLNGSDENIGMIHLNNDKKKEIHIASPWNYPRSFTLLHEIGHLVYEKHLDKEWKERWQGIVKKTKKKLNQSAEELWCHNFANYFSKNKIVIHTHPEWDKYMEEFCKKFG